MTDYKNLPQISVVILCYRAGNFAKVFHQKVAEILKREIPDYEIVLVGNFWPNTSDITPVVVETLAKEKERTIAVIKEKKNKKEAMGFDLRSGLGIATGETIAFIDGDGQMDPEDIPTLYKKLRNGNFDICKAKRISRADGFYRNFISTIFNSLMQLLFPGIISNDINGKPKIFTREAYRKLNLVSDDWFIDAEIMIKVRRYKFKGGEMETKFHENKARQSFISLAANIEFLKNILVWRIKEFQKK